MQSLHEALPASASLIPLSSPYVSCPVIYAPGDPGVCGLVRDRSFQKKDRKSNAVVSKSTAKSRPWVDEDLQDTELNSRDEEEESEWAASEEDVPHVPYAPARYAGDVMLNRAREFYALMNGRRSVRFISPEPVPREVIDYVIRTAEPHALSGAVRIYNPVRRSLCLEMKDDAVNVCLSRDLQIPLDTRWWQYIHCCSGI
ncbi:hypothetical protein COCON_G00099160 [Conger conger]|uniref:Uncharacterized protein n=1 Tax=Conger conger TaxID=82655 RepID=A0A9Q1DMM0_CONCO|nr:hypothetical protein COCON_G00099160 [Conger conger]